MVRIPRAKKRKAPDSDRVCRTADRCQGISLFGELPCDFRRLTACSDSGNRLLPKIGKKPIREEAGREPFLLSWPWRLPGKRSAEVRRVRPPSCSRSASERGIQHRRPPAPLPIRSFWFFPEVPEGARQTDRKTNFRLEATARESFSEVSQRQRTLHGNSAQRTRSLASPREKKSSDRDRDNRS